MRRRSGRIVDGKDPAWTAGHIEHRHGVRVSARAAVAQERDEFPVCGVSAGIDFQRSGRRIRRRGDLEAGAHCRNAIGPDTGRGVCNCCRWRAVPPAIAVEIVRILIDIGVGIAVIAVVEDREVADLRDDASLAVEARLRVKAPMHPIQFAFGTEIDVAPLGDRTGAYHQSGSAGHGSPGIVQAERGQRNAHGKPDQVVSGSQQRPQR